MKKNRFTLFGICLICLMFCSQKSTFGQFVPAGYKGTPFKGVAQTIPGRIEFENYDAGGLGVAFDVDLMYDGPVKDYRPGEGEQQVSIDETNTVGNVDKFTNGTLYPSAANPNSKYCGWMHAGDWMRLTVNVTKSAKYRISSTFANELKSISIHMKIDDKAIPVIKLNHPGGWHTWVVYDNMAEIYLEKGTHLIHFESSIAHLNYDYLQFTDIDSPGEGTLTSITVSPATTNVQQGQNTTFTANGFDENGNPMAVQPLWTVSGGGSITQAGVFTGIVIGGPYTITASAEGISGTAQVTVTNGPTGDPVPGIIQAENYIGMLGVQKETTTDAGGGQDVGYIGTGDWMTYRITVASTGTYKVNFRASGWVTPMARITLQDAANMPLTSANVPNGGAGSYQKWSTIPGESTFTLQEGTQTIRLFATIGSWNLNWFEIASVEPSVLTSIVVTPATASVELGGTVAFKAQGLDQNNQPMAANVTWTVTGGGTISTTGIFTAAIAGGPYTITATDVAITGNASVIVLATPPGDMVPGTIQAENYIEMLGVQKETTTDAGGGQNVGYIGTGDWMTYRVTVATTGSYNINFRASGWVTPQGRITVQNSSNTILTSAYVPNGGAASYQKWSTITGESSIMLQAGTQIIKIFATVGSWNLNWFSLELAPPSTRIQAESYTTMKGILTENTTDAGGGKDVGWTEAGDYMNYNVIVPSDGLYSINFRVASQVNTGAIELRNAAGLKLASLALNPGTGAWQTWTTKTVTATLQAGAQTLQIYYTGAGMNINWFEIIGGGIKSAETISIVSDVKLFPIPAMDELNVRLGSSDFNSLEIYAIDGKFMYRQAVSGSEEIVIDLINTNIKTGLYIMRLSGDNKNVNQKFFVQ